MHDNGAKVIVFGGSGFVGTHYIRWAIGRGLHVVSVDILPPREELPGVDYRVGDVRDLSGFTVSGKIARIYNFAAVHTTPGHAFWEYYDTNVNGALEITRWAEQNGIKEMVFTSSISIYGPSEEMKTEASIPAPASAYGYSKLLAEKIHERWLDSAPDYRLTIARPAVVFGQGESGNFTRMAKLLKKGGFVYPGRKDTIKACIYVEDLVAAIEFARNQEERTKTANMCYPERYELETIVETFSTAYFPKARKVMMPYWVVSSVASILKRLDFVGMGFHPERVLKLVRSTDIYPGWLEENGFKMPFNLSGGLERWHEQSSGTFDLAHD